MNDNETYFFDVNGYLTIRNALSPEQISALNRQIDLQIGSCETPTKPHLSFNNVLGWRGAMIGLIDNPSVVPYLDALLGPPPYADPRHGPFFRLDHTYVTVLRPDGTREDIGCDALVAYNLTDVNEGDGGFGCVPGSHKANFRIPRDWNDLRKPNPIARAVGGPAGTAVVFTEALSHGTLPWHGDHERRTVFFKYNTYCSAFGATYLDEMTSTWQELSERQRAILEAPNSRGPARRGQAMLAQR